MKGAFLDWCHEKCNWRNVSRYKRQDSNEPFSVAMLERQEVHIQTEHASYD